MNYLPAGAEDESDDEFDLGDENEFISDNWDEEPVHAPSKSSLHNEYLQTKISPKNGKSSPFGRLGKGPSPRRDQKGSPLISEDLRTASTKGNVAQVQNFIQRGVKVDTVLRGGWTPLMYSAANGHVELVQYLLEQGANPTYNMADGMYCPILAVCTSKCPEDVLIECVTLLVDHGAQVNVHERSHMTPLMFACHKGMVKLVSKLILCGADTNKQDNRQWTPLCYAAFSGNQKVVKLLLENGADPTVSCFDGTAADIAYGEGFTEVADYIEKKINPASRSLVNDDSAKQSGQNDEEDFDRKQFTYNDLELFLCGLELGDLIPLFRDQKVSFADLLQYSEDDLEKMGIQEFGWRRKIMKSVHEIHRIKWEKGSVRNPTHKIISQQESVAILDNINQHVAYITSSLVYIQRNWAENDTINESQNDGLDIRQLSTIASESINRVTVLHGQLKKMKKVLNKASNTQETLPVDLIPDTNDRRSFRVFLLAVGTALTVVAFYKWGPSLEKLGITR